MIDVLVVGAGFSGLFLVHRLTQEGLVVQGVERAPDVGGTWYWNRYPGARCDIESVDYCYSFDDDLVAEWRWTERFASQPEILAYLNHVADRFDLRQHFRFSTSITSLAFNEESSTWTARTDGGDTLVSRFVVMATGNLSEVQRPNFDGLDDFEGRWFHTGQWPTEPVDFTGRRVAIIGTGSSAIQTIPVVAEQADYLAVLQRTPNYSMPAHNRPLTDAEIEEVLESWHQRRKACEEGDAGTPLPDPTERAVDATPEQRKAAYDEGWSRGGISSLSFAFNDMFRSEESNRYAQDYARERIRAIVADPQVADLLCPQHHIGTKRTCTDTRYFETFNRANVELIDVKSHPIESITARGIRTSQREIEVDDIIFAIGFDAISGALTAIDIRGRHARSLRDAWTVGPRAYLGVQVADFPNLFLVTGPGSPSVLSNMVVSIEQHVEWIAGALVYLRANGFDTMEATSNAENDWMAHVDELAAQTLYPLANSWYVGANIPGKRHPFPVYVAGCGPFRHESDAVAAGGYRGFALSTSSSPEGIEA